VTIRVSVTQQQHLMPATILIADDHDDNRELLRLLLSAPDIRSGKPETETSVLPLLKTTRPT